jgi:hypothetical protein
MRDLPPEDRAELRALPDKERQKRLALPPKEQAELKEWHRQHHFHPHQLRHNAGTYLRM